MSTRTGDGTAPLHSCGPLVCALREADQVQGVGGKAAQLARMLRRGLPVPHGLVLTHLAFQTFLAVNELTSQAARLRESLDRGDEQALRREGGELRQRVLTARIPEAVREQWRILLPPGPVAVRSSALGEDSAEASFAGQLDSFLHVNPSEDLERSILACWASFWSERALFYQRHRGVRLAGMGVILQEMVAARCAGVLFTRNPEGGRSDTSLIEYGPGTGEAVVSGRLTPGRIVLRRGDRQLIESRAMESESHEGIGPRTDQVAKLADMGLGLEEDMGGPQDVEWAVSGDERVYLLQSRPITTLRPQGGKTVVWSNANVNENFPEPITPLLYSVATVGYYHYFRNLALAFGFDRERVWAMEHPLRHLIGVHGCRMYYNLTNIHAVLRQAPFGETLAGFFNSFVGTDRTDPRTVAAGSSLRGRIARTIELGRVFLKTAWCFLFLTRRVKTFERTVDDFGQRTDPAELGQRTASQLLDDLRGFLHIRCHQWTHAALADTASMITYGALKRILSRSFPQDECGALHNTLLKGLANLVSSVPLDRLWEISRRVRETPQARQLFASASGDEISVRLQESEELVAIRHDVEEYLRTWGFRRSGELMLTTPSFQERPGELLEIVRSYAARDGESPREKLARQEAERDAETVRVLAQLRRRKLVRFLPWPTTATVVRRLLRWARHAIALRERARLKQAFLYNRLRRIALAIGERLREQRRLKDANEIFFLTYQEIDDLLSGTSMFPEQTAALVQLRRTEHKTLGKTQPPDRLELEEGSYLAMVMPYSSSEAEGNTLLSGVGACGGSVTGTATVLHDVAEFGRLGAGDILVTRQTDPGWGPVFPLIRGLVIERGGMLSHGAIIAREYGIPAVVGVKDAMRRITTGTILHVDGDRGLVRIDD